MHAVAIGSDLGTNYTFPTYHSSQGRTQRSAAHVCRTTCRRPVRFTSSMAARSPPARPHIGIHPSNHFSSRVAGDWGEDDAWDSASDSESPRQSSLAKSWNRSSSSSSTTAPRPVPKPVRNSSSSTLAFSYTHVSAPDPSSYPPREDTALAPKNGWTLVKKSNDRKQMESSNTSGQTDDGVLGSQEGQGDADVEGDMILGDLESEVVAPDTSQAPAHVKAKHGQGSIREDVDKIVHGICVLP